MLCLEIIKGGFTVSKLRSWKDVPEGQFVFAAETDCEISLVCPDRLVPDGALISESGWSMMRIKGQLEFSLIGILSGLTAVLAENKIGVFAISTYDTDYLMVKTSELSGAVKAIETAGYTVEAHDSL